MTAPVANAPSRDGVAPAKPVALGAGLPRRRRAWVMALALALVVAGGWISASLWATQDQSQPFLMVARPVAWGQQVGDGDLGVVRLIPNPGLRLVPADQRASVVGKTAAARLVPGMVLSGDLFSDGRVPGPGQQRVGLLVKPGQMPAQGVQPGDQVQLIAATGGQTTTADAAPVGPQWRAQVAGVGAPDANGGVTVDVVVDQAVGAQVAATGAAGRVVLVLLPAGS